jgi:hypothetical protein
VLDISQTAGSLRVLLYRSLRLHKLVHPVYRPINMNIEVDAEFSDLDYETEVSSFGPPRPMRLTVRGDIDDLAVTLLNLRALQAFDHGPAHYPIHRVVRCAVRGSLVNLFDDLTLRAGLTAQRLDAGLLLLDGTGVLATLQGRHDAKRASRRRFLRDSSAGVS